MDESMIDRRTFCKVLAASVSVSACARQRPPDETSRQGLVRLLGLRGSEIEWLSTLSDKEQDALYTALLSPGSVRGGPNDRAAGLLMKLLGRRERLFAYVGYPPLSNTLSGCNGLIRE